MAFWTVDIIERNNIITFSQNIPENFFSWKHIGQMNHEWSKNPFAWLENKKKSMHILTSRTTLQK